MIINLNERQHLIGMAYNPDVYGTKMPMKSEGQWMCPHCDFEGDIEKMAAHLASECDESYNEAELLKD